MPELSDRSPEATKIAEQQQARLRRFREALTPNQREAARAAGVTKDAWNNMERGRSRVEVVALARLCHAYGVVHGGPPLSADYVVLGLLTGLPDGLIRQITDIEREEAASPPAAASAAGSTAPAPAGSSDSLPARRKNGRRRRTEAL